MVPDARGRETFFGFFRYPPTLRDQNGREIMPTPGANSWLFEDVMENPDPQFRKIVARFAEAGYVQKERDELAAD